MVSKEHFPGRALGALLLALILPACGANNSTSSPTTPPATLLFIETWDGVAPGAGGSFWSPSIPLGRGGIDTISVPSNPSLSITSPAGSETILTTTVAPVNSILVAPSLTLSTLLSVSATGGGIGLFRIDSATQTARADYDASVDMITLAIGPTPALTTTPGTTFVTVPAAAGSYHQLMFIVGPTGVSQWFLDGAPASAGFAWTAGTVSMTLGAAYGSVAPFAQFNFDSIVATTP